MYTNFRIEKIVPNHPLHLVNSSLAGANLFKTIIAKVDHTTGYLWWKKTDTITVFNTSGGLGFWRYLDTGRFTEGTLVENLYDVYQIKNKLDKLTA